ncbi:hypothetical protein CRENBAI_005905 [Crenichthys baileyi]|uniref:Uncharacterized protein n=1 Tax=Crenichthys baileyi TaxID=28760 RepID=A0AAV9SRP8_9TELE
MLGGDVTWPTWKLQCQEFALSICHSTHPPTDILTGACTQIHSLSAERRAPACLPSHHPTNPWLAAIGGTQSGVLMLRLGEETLVNLPIACHWP